MKFVTVEDVRILRDIGKSDFYTLLLIIHIFLLYLFVEQFYSTQIVSICLPLPASWLDCVL